MEEMNSVLPAKRQLAIIYACIFVVMIGFGLTLPVLAFYIERLALTEGATSQQASGHVGALTGIFALMQFLFAPLWGRLSDRTGRRPLFLIGLTGYAISMLLFGIGTNLTVLYAARIVGGILSSAVLPAASAYITDLTSATERGTGMARVGGAIGLGIVIGPALGALLSRLNWHLTFRFGHFSVDDFSMPFFAAALLALFTLLAARRWLPESLPPAHTQSPVDRNTTAAALHVKYRLWFLRGSLGQLLGLSILSQFALALFEGTFALHAQQVMSFGPTQMGVVFMICGLVMGVLQAGAVGWLIAHKGEKNLLPIGFSLVGVALVMLMTAKNMAFILAYVALFALGMSLITPSLTALVTKRAGKRSGAALGLQSAANSLGQASGPLVGGLLFAWHIHAPYLITAIPLIGTAMLIGRKTWSRIALNK